jgi:hypothetical protein
MTAQWRSVSGFLTARLRRNGAHFIQGHTHHQGSAIKAFLPSRQNG